MQDVRPARSEHATVLILFPLITTTVARTSSRYGVDAVKYDLRGIAHCCTECDDGVKKKSRPAPRAGISTARPALAGGEFSRSDFIVSHRNFISRRRQGEGWREEGGGKERMRTGIRNYEWGTSLAAVLYPSGT